MIGISKRRARGLERYDLDRVYWLKAYNETLSYGRQHSDVPSVQAQINKLNAEKERYTSAVKSIADAERAAEEEKYQKYEKWSKRKKKFGTIAIISLVSVFVIPNILSHMPSSLAGLLDLVLAALVVIGMLVGAAIFLVSAIVKSTCEAEYKSYITSIKGRFEDMGKAFEQNARTYYNEIDSLYLASLEPSRREVVLLRRDQERHNEETKRMEAERQRLERERLAEQRRATEALQKLLAIEEKREREYRDW